VNGSKAGEWVAEFVPLNRRRLSGGPSLSVAELRRWGELRELLSWELGLAPPSSVGAERPLRVPSHLKLHFGNLGEKIGLLGNVSEGGFFIETERPLRPGTPLQIELDPGDGEAPLDLSAVVVWDRNVPGEDGPAGFGVQFRNLHAEDLARLARLVERALGELLPG
jgi:uncharacterized protein (TIGR02266 family)